MSKFEDRKALLAQLSPKEFEALYDLQHEVNNLVAHCHGRARAAGWWTDLKTGEPINVHAVVPEKLMLIVSEVSEAMEGHRKGLPDDKLPWHPMLGVELADAMIRIGDLAGALGIDLGAMLAEKLGYNAVREDHKLASRMADGGKKY